MFSRSYATRAMRGAIRRSTRAVRATETAPARTLRGLHQTPRRSNVLPWHPSGNAVGGLRSLRRGESYPFAPHISPFSSSSDGKRDDDSDNSEETKGGDSAEEGPQKARLGVRFGRLGQFVDDLSDNIKSEVEKNEQLKTRVDELSGAADKLRDVKVGGKNVDETTAEARERASKMYEEASEQAKARAEELSSRFGGLGEGMKGRLEEGRERARGTWGRVSDQLKDSAEDLKEKNEYVRGAADRASKARQTAQEASASVAKTSVFQRFSAAVKDTITEAKEDLLGDAARGSDGRRAKPRRKRAQEGAEAWQGAINNWAGRRAAAAKRRGAGASETSGAAAAAAADAATATGESTASAPAPGDDPAASEWSEAVDPESGNVYYYNVKTGETSWEKPSSAPAAEGSSAAGASEWSEAQDPESGETYYFNSVTGESSWERPEGLDGEGAADAGAAGAGTGAEAGGGEDREDPAGDILIVDAGESTWSRIRERLTKTPLIQDILGASSQGARQFSKTDAGRSIKQARTKAGNVIEDAREVWETSQNPIIYELASMYDNVFAETEIGQAVKELRRLDNKWNLHDWLDDVGDYYAPEVLNAYMQGDETLLKGLCAETAAAMISAAIADRKQNGYVLDSTILDIGGTTLLAARILDKAPPIMVVQFEAQQIHCIMDKKGAVVEGADDEIRNNFYCIAMQRDWDEEEEGLKWKILEFMTLGSIPYQ